MALNIKTSMKDYQDKCTILFDKIMMLVVVSRLLIGSQSGLPEPDSVWGI